MTTWLGVGASIAMPCSSILDRSGMSRAIFTSLSVIFLREYSGIRKLNHANRRHFVPGHEQPTARGHSLKRATSAPYELFVKQHATTIRLPVQPSSPRKHPDNLVPALGPHAADNPLASTGEAAEQTIPGIPWPAPRPNFARQPTFDTPSPFRSICDGVIIEAAVEGREDGEPRGPQCRSPDASYHSQSKANRDAQRGQLGESIESFGGRSALFTEDDREQFLSAPQVEERPSDRARQDGRPNLAQNTTNS